MSNRFGVTRLTSALAGILAAGLILSGCAGGEGGRQTDSAGVSFGASIEEYQSAFKNIQPIKLRLQTDGPEGSLSNVGREQWAKAIVKWSGGKIGFEFGYSNSFAPASTEWAAALADGRIDVGYFLPYYTPDDFPALSALSNATFLDGNRPLSTLVSTGWVTETTFRRPEYVEEAEQRGIHILTLAPSANIPGIFCTKERTSLTDFQGVPISASGKGRFDELKSLGFTPQSIAFTELYEAIQRGVVSCGSTVPSALDTIGAVQLVPYAIADPQASLVGFPNYLAVGKAAWDSLPLVARQLMFDRLDVFLTEELKARSKRNADWLRRIKAAGGGIRPLGDDARQALLARNNDLLNDLAGQGADTKSFVAARDKWNAIVNEQLYPDVTSSLEEFFTAKAYETVDVQPFVDAFFKQVLLKNRPS
ncbi:hypothetical protein [Nonomuraea sp. NPDC005650]|uniref:hypothetical protein n=1 Tax=Nonomuraea sp. NPDC005650 TaxID=3157045 RepID=UPI0033A02097